MMGAHPLICTTVELTLFNKYIAPWIEAWKRETTNIVERGLNRGLPFLWTEEEFHEFLEGFLDKAYQKVVEKKPQARYILDKQPNYSMHVDDINCLFPNALFIHIIRDGRDVAASMISARRTVGFGYGTIQEAGISWVKHARAAQSARKFGDRYIEVRYEDLLNDSANTLRTVFEFCRLTASEEFILEVVNNHQFELMKSRKQLPDEKVKSSEGHYRKGIAGDWITDLSSFQKYQFDKIAGDLLCELGYSRKGWWVEHICQHFTIPFLFSLREAKNRVIKALKNLLGDEIIKRVKYIRSKYYEGTASNIKF